MVGLERKSLHVAETVRAGRIVLALNLLHEQVGFQLRLLAGVFSLGVG